MNRKGRKKDMRGMKENATLEQKDLHCLARILQVYQYMGGDMFGGCSYCVYQESCNRDAKEGKMYFTK